MATREHAGDKSHTDRGYLQRDVTNDQKKKRKTGNNDNINNNNNNHDKYINKRREGREGGLLKLRYYLIRRHQNAANSK